MGCEMWDDIKLNIINNMVPNARRDTAPAIIAYNNTVNNDKEKVDESMKKENGRWFRIRLMYLITFLESFAWTMSLTSLWPYILSIDPSSSILFLTIVNISHGVFEFISTLLFGWWFDSRGPNEPLVLSNILFIADNFVYGISGSIDHHGTWLVLVSRSLLGISGEAMTIGRSVATKLCKEGELSKAMSQFSLSEAVAFFVAPITALFNAYIVGEDGLYVHQLGLHLNMYTVPVWILLIIGLINFLLQIKYFYRDYKDYCTQENDLTGIECNGENSSSNVQVDKCAVGVLLVTHLAVHMTMSLDETTSPFLKDYFALTNKESMIYSSITAMLYSFVGSIICALIPYFSKRINEKKLLLFGLIVNCIGLYLFMPFGQGKLKIAQTIKGINSTVTNITVTGCPSHYKWCYSSPTFPVPQLVFSDILMTCSDPFAFAVLPSVYASIVRHANQGRYIGLLTGMEPISKIITPTISGPLYAKFGLTGSFLFAGGLFSLVTISFLFTWKRLNPN